MTPPDLNAAEAEAELARAGELLARWIDVLHHPRDAERLRAAVTDDIRLDRRAPAPRAEVLAAGPEEAPPPAEAELAAARAAEAAHGHAHVILSMVLEGFDAVAAWVQRTPPGGVFTLAGEPARVGDAVRVEYAYRYDDFANGGIWFVRARGDRLAWLSHRPFALET